MYGNLISKKIMDIIIVVSIIIGLFVIYWVCLKKCELKIDKWKMLAK